MAKDIFKKACKLNIKIELPNTTTSVDSRSGGKLDVYDTKGVVDVIGIWKLDIPKLTEIYNTYNERLYKLENNKSLFDDIPVDKEKIKETKLIMAIVKEVAKDKKKEEKALEIKREAKKEWEKLVRAKERAEEDSLSKKNIKELEKEMAKMEVIFKG